MSIRDLKAELYDLKMQGEALNKRYRQAAGPIDKKYQELTRELQAEIKARREAEEKAKEAEKEEAEPAL